MPFEIERKFSDPNRVESVLVLKQPSKSELRNAQDQKPKRSMLSFLKRNKAEIPAHEDVQTEADESEPQRYLVSWKGGNIPKGVTVDGHEITDINNGQVFEGDGNIIGSYERTMKFGGAENDEHQIELTLFKRSEAK